jgi:hypothetical protein
MTPGLDRRTVVVGLPLAAILIFLAPVEPTAAKQNQVVRVSGDVTAANYHALAAMLSDSFDKVVGLNLSFGEDDGYEEGKLSAYEDGDLFVAYVPGPDNDTQISANGGYALKDGAYVFDGFYEVVYGGMGQGIVAISLEKTKAPAGSVQDVDIDSLKAPG